MTAPSGGERPLVHGFDADHADLTAEERRALLGAKGAALAEMTGMGLPVPPGFTLTTTAGRRVLSGGWDHDLEAALRSGLDRLEAATGRRLGDPDAPLLVSVRAGAEVSMPGMLASVLDVGITDRVTDGLRAGGMDADFVADTRARAQRSWDEHVGGPLPDDALVQLRTAIVAAFRSWGADHVREYRAVEAILDDTGVGVTVQAMVFGNRGERSGTGIAFTRDPSTGEPGLMGDFVPGVQGDDVVSGNRPTLPLTTVRDRWPELWDELVEIAARLERHVGDLVDIELTIEEDRLWVLQARPAKRSPLAALRVAVDLAEDPGSALDRRGAVDRCRRLLELDDASWRAPAPTDPDVEPLVEGLAAAPGRAVGVLCLDGERADQLRAEGVAVVLARQETTPADVPAMASVAGVVTALGGLVSHAAVLAREWGIPAVVGAAEMRFVDGGLEGPGGFVRDGEVVTVDGDAGRLLRGSHPAGPPTVPEELATLRRWADELG